MGQTKVWHLAGGPQGMVHFLDHLGPAVEDWWSDLGTAKLDAPTGELLAAAYTTDNFDRDVAGRDRALLRRLHALAADATED